MSQTIPCLKASLDYGKTNSLFCVAWVIALLSWSGYTVAMESNNYIITQLSAPPRLNRDPTEPVTLPANNGADSNVENPTNAYELQSVMIRKTERIALINNEYVHVGESIGQAKVVAIEHNTVTLLLQGKTITLYLFASDIWK